jgi:hypothetical protein
MNKINILNHDSVRRINLDINAALKAVAEKYGVEIEIKGSRFSDNNCTTRIEIATVAESGSALTKEAVDFNRYALSQFRITKKLGDRFTFKYEEYEITGLAPRSLKYPVLAKNLTSGNTFKFPLHVINQ